jgi:hypothetical protein
VAVQERWCSSASWWDEAPALAAVQAAEPALLRGSGARRPREGERDGAGGRKPVSMTLMFGYFQYTWIE